MEDLQSNDHMLKLEFTNEEIKDIKAKIHFTEMQERIIEYRLNEYSITKMAILENCSEATISREINKIKKKIMRIIWQEYDKNIFFFYATM